MSLPLHPTGISSINAASSELCTFRHLENVQTEKKGLFSHLTCISSLPLVDVQGLDLWSQDTC